jgi:hypothetical protein
MSSLFLGLAAIAQLFMQGEGSMGYLLVGGICLVVGFYVGKIATELYHFGRFWYLA